MLENSNTTAVENETKVLEMDISADLANAMLAVIGIPMPDAADLSAMNFRICDTPLLNRVRSDMAEDPNPLEL